MAILTIQPSSKDTFIRENWPTTNFGSETYLQLTDKIDVVRRCLLEFDISTLPSGESINSITLMLYYYSYSGDDPDGIQVKAYKLIRNDWVELQATWEIYKTGSDWTADGGDYVTSDPAGATLVMPGSYGWVSFNVKAIVDDAVANEWSVAEFLIRLASEDVDDYSILFYSNNYTGDTSLCPKLVIDYEPPPAAGRSFGFIIG